MRNLIVVLGDQLDSKSSAFDRFDKRQDAVWMAELAGEASYVWSHKARIAIFFSAMRHFRDSMRKRGLRVHYWLYMPQYLERNAPGADQPLPDFYRTGETEMNCLRQPIGQTLDCGYAHHIQRLMVTGLFALLEFLS